MALTADKSIELNIEKIIKKAKKKKARVTPLQIIGIIFLCLVAVIYVYPIFWMLDSSFRPMTEIFNLPPQFMQFNAEPDEKAKMDFAEKYKLEHNNAEPSKEVMDNFINAHRRLLPSFSSYSLDNYKHAFERGVGNSFLMSVIVTGLGVVLTLFLTSLCAYAFAFLRFPFKNVLFYFILLSFMLPTITQIPPYYKLITRLDAFYFFAVPMGIFIIYRIVLLINRFNKKNLIYVIAALILSPLALFLLDKSFGLGKLSNNLLGLILPSAITALGVFLLRQFYIKLPYSLIESAFLDGASHFKIWWNIIMPLSTPALAALSIYQFRGLWNDFLYPMIILRDQTLFTIPVEIKLMDSINFNKPYDAIMATGFLFSLIPIVIFLVFQRYFIEGLSGGSKK